MEFNGIQTLSKLMSMRFLVVLSILSGFHFGSKFGRHSFSVNLFISKVFFSQQELHFCFYDSNLTIFARANVSNIPSCNSTLNTLPSITNQTEGLHLAMRVYIIWKFNISFYCFSRVKYKSFNNTDSFKIVILSPSPLFNYLIALFLF